MPVTISLMKLAQFKARELWPSEFSQLIAAAEAEIENGDNRDPLTMIVDWLDANDEPAFARAFRYVVKRPKCKIEKHTYGGWTVGDEFPYGFGRDIEGDRSTLAGAVALLAEKIERIRADLE